MAKKTSTKLSAIRSAVDKDLKNRNPAQLKQLMDSTEKKLKPVKKLVEKKNQDTMSLVFETPAGKLVAKTDYKANFDYRTFVMEQEPEPFGNLILK